MIPIQILLLVFFSLAIIKVATRKYHGEISFGAALMWITFWLVAGAIVIQPDLTSAAAKLFGVGRGADVVVYLALVGLFFMVFRLTVKIEKLNKEITKVVRGKAIAVISTEAKRSGEIPVTNERDSSTSARNDN